jgi:hypothetical protein
MSEESFFHDLAHVRRAVRHGDWKWAESRCRSALALEDDPRLRTMLGVLAAKQGQTGPADGWLESAFKGLAPADLIREGLTEPVCDLADPDLACRLLWHLRETFGDHPCLRPRSRRPGHWSAGLLAGLPHSSRYWPAMTEYQIRAVLAALGAQPRPRVLEWGSGNSTVYFSAKLSSLATWDAIEHDASWLSFVNNSPRLQEGARVRLHAVAADAPLSDPHDDGDLRSFGRYVRYPASLGSRYDFILVDGRARTECLREGWSLLRPGGILALHDSERAEYRPGLPATPYRIGLAQRHLDGDQIRLDFFLKSRSGFAALGAALEHCLPAYVEVERRPVEDQVPAAST